MCQQRWDGTKGTPLSQAKVHPVAPLQRVLQDPHADETPQSEDLLTLGTVLADPQLCSRAIKTQCWIHATVLEGLVPVRTEGCQPG